MIKYTFYVSGTHCKACKVLIEDIIGEQAGVAKVSVDLGKRTMTVEGESLPSAEELISVWNKLLAEHKYELYLDDPGAHAKKDFGALATAIPLGLVVLTLFLFLQKSGIVNLGFEGGLTPLTAAMIGVIASLSSCLAVVGGLVLSLSASISADVKTTRPFMFFHFGRIFGFILLGGILGSLGKVLAINSTVTSVMGILATLVMIILGINLLDVFHLTKKMQLSLPTGLFKKLTKIENGFFAPLLLGMFTFFLPCGFTQSMQLAALSSGSFLGGSIIMGSFVLGTFPVLALLSFGSFRFAHTRYASLFFKTAGIVVIGLGIFALLSVLAGLGIISPIFNI